MCGMHPVQELLRTRTRNLCNYFYGSVFTDTKSNSLKCQNAKETERNCCRVAGVEECGKRHRVNVKLVIGKLEEVTVGG